MWIVMTPEATMRERRHLTVMFCDVVGSTRLSRRRDVESYFSLLRAYYDACRPVVERHGGLIAQHHGDGIYVWFGYPRPAEDDAVRAVRAGLDLLIVLRRLSARLQAETGEPLDVRISAHVGEVLVASVANEAGPLAFGHTPNLAAKLQQFARPGTLIVSEALLRMVDSEFDVVALPEATLPDGAVARVYEVIKERQRAGRVRGTWRTPLIGREPETAALRQAWDAARDGPGRTVALVGDRGLGKTRLASTLAATARAEGATVLDSAGSRWGPATAYRTLRTLLAQAAGIEPDAPPAVGGALLHDHIVRALGMGEAATPVLAAVAGLPDGTAGALPDVDPSRLAQITSEALAEWVGRLTTVTPTVVLLDDVADIDPSSLDVLARLAADPPVRFLLVVTAQSVAALPPSFVNESTSVLTLTPLTDSAAQDLVAAVTGTTPLDPQIAEKVVQDSDGVPLYLEELARAAQEVAGESALPAALSGYLQARLAVPGIDRGVVNALAVAGHDIAASVLSSALGIDPDELRARIAGLLARDLVVDVGMADPAYRFRHGLIAEAAYSLVLHDERTRLHGRLADAMAARHTPDWNIVAHHLALAGRPLDAFEAVLAGAGVAGRAGAIHEAMQGYRVALDLLGKIADLDVRDRLEIRCRLQRGATAISARGWGADEAIEDFERCAEICRRLGPRPEHVSVMTGVYSFYLIQGELPAARRVAEELRSWIDTDDDTYRADNTLAFGLVCFYEGDYAGALECLRTAVQQFEAKRFDGQPEQDWPLPFDPYAITLAHLANVAWITGSPREATTAGDRAVARAASLRFPEGPFTMAYVKTFLAWTYQIRGYHDTAARLAADVVEIARRHGFAYWESTGEIHLAIAEYGAARRPDAADRVAMHASIWELLHARVFLPYTLTAEAALRADMGNPGEAAARFEAAARVTRQTGSRFYEAERLRLLVKRGGPSTDESRASLRAAADLARQQGALLFELRAVLDLARSEEGTRLEKGAATGLAAVLERFPAAAGYPELIQARAVLARIPSPT
jgi:class 3 adenylate cyclase/tetratricopeptide (TPR) repeat protein